MTAAAPRLLISTPCYGGLVTDHYLMSSLNLQALLARNGIGFDFTTIKDSLITRARNNVASRFLAEGGYTHLLFIDADLGYDPSAVLRYLAFGKDVVCGIYPTKHLDLDAIRRSRAETAGIAEAATHVYSSALSIGETNQPVDGFLRAEYAATGFMMIARPVLERMAEAYPELRYQGDHIMHTGAGPAATCFAFFDTMIADGRSLPEDYAFCHRWRRIGGEIWVDLLSRFSHVGTYVYRGDLPAAITEAAREQP